MRLVLSLLAGTLLAQVHALWPAPASLTNGSTPLKLSSTFSISTSSLPSPPSDLTSAISRTISHLKSDNLAPLVIGRGSSSSFLSPIQNAHTLTKLNIKLASGAPAIQSITTETTKLLTSRDESYTLTVPSDGSAATLTAKTSLGMLRGLTTFEQLWFTSGGLIYTKIAPIKITDKPAFPYRGFLLDTSRNFYPVSDIERVLDSMSAVKLNTFHWHITDAQSWPVVVPSNPELSAKGAYSSVDVYSTSDVKGVVAYGAQRGVDVMVEIDTPGHTSSIAASHPELIACADASPWGSFANEPPAGQLRFASPNTTTFISNVFTSLTSLFPGKLFATGGDELNTNCYMNDAPTQASLKASGKTLEQALSAFTVGTHGALRAKGKTPVVWEEMVLSHNVTLGSDTAVLVWISSDDVTAVVNKGFRVIHAASNYFYLDCGGGGWVGDNINGNSWCDPFKTWQYMYSFDPFAGLSTSAQKAKILGGEALLWSEQSDPSNLDPIAWPRAAVPAEIFWTGATLPSGAARNVVEALPRLHELRYRLVQRGVRAIALQPLWCVLRPNECNL